MVAPAMILACLLGHSGVAVGSVQPTATWQCRWGRMVGVKHVSLHWGVNPGPSISKPDALPLRYRGIFRKYLRAQQFPNTLRAPNVGAAGFLGIAELTNTWEWLHPMALRNSEAILFHTRDFGPRGPRAAGEKNASAASKRILSSAP